MEIEMKEAEMWCSLKIPFYFRGDFLSLSFKFYFPLHRVFVAVHGPSLVVATGG